MNAQVSTSAVIREQIDRMWRRYGALVVNDCHYLAADVRRAIRRAERDYRRAVRREKRVQP